MCTLMQKDALIELVANAQAIVTKRIEPDLPLIVEEIRLGEIRDYLYSNAPEDISYSAIVDEIQAIQGKFENKPILSRYM